MQKVQVNPETMKQEICTIWGEIFNLTKTEVCMNFFDLGGDSIDALAFSRSISKEYNVKISIEDVFKFPTLSDFIDHVITLLDNENSYTSNKILKAPERDYYDTYVSQKAYYFICQKNNITTSFNLTKVIKIKGKLNVEKLEYSFKQLIERHESLRTTFKFEKGQLLQKIFPSIGYNLDIKRLGKSSDECIKANIKEFIKPFVLLENLLFRTILLELEEDNYIFLIDIHHMVSDGTSQNILIRDLFKIYNGEDLPKLNIQYKDYVEWYNNYRRTGEFKKEKEYWENIFKTEPNYFNLPYDSNDEGSIKESRINIYEIDEAKSKKIKGFCEKRNISLYIYLIAIYKLFIFNLTGNRDITIGSISSGRNHKDCINLVGAFINMIPVRSYIEPGISFGKFLEQVKSSILKGLDNQNCSYGYIVKEILNSDLSKPLFNIVFNSHNFGNDVLSKTNELLIEDIRLKKEPQARYDIINYIGELNNKIQINVEYSTSKFKPETINRFMAKYIMLTESVLDEVYGV